MSKSRPCGAEARGVSAGIQESPKLEGVPVAPPPPKNAQKMSISGSSRRPGWDGAHCVARLVRSEPGMLSDTDGSDAPPGPSTSDYLCGLDRPRRVHRRHRVPLMYSSSRAWRGRSDQKASGTACAWGSIAGQSWPQRGVLAIADETSQTPPFPENPYFSVNF